LRYLKKILTDAEIEIVQEADNPDITLWSFWACKETAYKVLGKSSAGLVFLPRCWQVKLTQHVCGYGEGEVAVPGKKTIFVQVYIADAYVHCIGSAELSALNKIVWDVNLLKPTDNGININPSAFGRECLLQRLADSCSLSIEDMDVRRAGHGRELREPCVYCGGTKAPFDISLSHDGQFVAYAFIKQFN
jgi:hypothetical protein